MHFVPAQHAEAGTPRAPTPVEALGATLGLLGYANTTHLHALLPHGGSGVPPMLAVV